MKKILVLLFPMFFWLSIGNAFACNMTLPLTFLPVPASYCGYGPYDKSITIRNPGINGSTFHFLWNSSSVIFRSGTSWRYEPTLRAIYFGLGGNMFIPPYLGYSSNLTSLGTVTNVPTGGFGYYPTGSTWEQICSYVSSATPDVQLYNTVTHEYCGYRPPPQLSITLNPPEGGSVTGDGIECGMEFSEYCEYEFDSGDLVDLTANPNCGWTFDHWDDGTLCYADNPWTVVMDGSKEVDAVFSPIVSTISVVPDTTQGSVSSNEEFPFIHCDDQPESVCSYGYAWNTAVTLTANPKPGYAFSHWEESGITVSTEREYCFLVEGSRELVPVFEEFRLGFPLDGYTSTSVPISAVMDHSVFDHTPVQFYQTDDIVEAFNGQIGDKQYGSRLTDGVWGYLMNISEDDFLAGYTYTEPKEYLFYDGHPGYDFAVPSGTDVLAPAYGKLYWAMSDPVNGDVSGFGTFYIDHGNGNATWFLHCSGLTQDVLDEIQQNGYATVYQGDHIAESSNKGTSGYHLHFEIRLNGIDDANVIDPYKEDMWE